MREMVEGSEAVEVQVMVSGRPGLICCEPAGEVMVRARTEGRRRGRRAVVMVVVVRMVGCVVVGWFEYGRKVGWWWASVHTLEDAMWLPWGLL